MKLISPEFIRSLAPQLDLLNTIGGGVAQPRMRVDQRSKGVLVRVALPSVSPDHFRVVLNDRQLTVLSEFRHQPEDTLAAPLFLQTLELPKNLDSTRIDAVQEDGELQIRIPFNNPADQTREIDVRHD